TTCIGMQYARNIWKRWCCLRGYEIGLACQRPKRQFQQSARITTRIYSWIIQDYFMILCFSVQGINPDSLITSPGFLISLSARTSSADREIKKPLTGKSVRG